MLRRRTFIALFGLLSVLGGACGRRGEVRRAAGLDVVLITVDTLRADALGAYGRKEAGTPWMDRLASSGVRFETAHAHNVVTLPSHANILSGRYPTDHGVRDNSGFRFPAETETLAAHLKAHGYRTAAFVSAFPLASRFGLGRGFDVYDDHFLGGSASALAEPQRKGPETVAAAQRWWQEAAGRPRFLWVHLYEPHFPYEPPEPFASRFPGAPYQGEVAAADQALEPLLRPLLEGPAGRPLVVLTADHGESLGEHGEKTHGIFAYEGSLRVPLVLQGPSVFGAAVIKEPVRHVDIVPTVLDALALPVPEGLAGRSLLPLIASRAGSPPATYFEALSGMTNRRWAPLYGVVQDRLKYLDLPLPELYDLARDPREETNLVASRPEAVETLRAALARLRSGERKVERRSEGPEVRDRLRSLGYVAAAESLPPKERYTEDDDPKRLIALDAEMHAVRARFRSGDLPGALALAEAVVHRRPGMPFALLELAALQREAGQVVQAVQTARAALVLSPEDAVAAAALGDYLSDAGRAEETIRLLEPYAQRIDPNPDVLRALGTALARRGRGRQALTCFAKLREMDPANPIALVDMAAVHLMEREPGRARKALEEALALDPGLARAHNGLGVVAAETGRPLEAIENWRRAVELDPRDLETLYNLGALLVREGRAVEARPFLERFVASAPPALYRADLARVRSWLGRPGG